MLVGNVTRKSVFKPAGSTYIRRQLILPPLTPFFPLPSADISAAGWWACRGWYIPHILHAAIWPSIR